MRERSLGEHRAGLMFLVHLVYWRAFEEVFQITYEDVLFGGRSLVRCVRDGRVHYAVLVLGESRRV